MRRVIGLVAAFFLLICPVYPVEAEFIPADATAATAATGEDTAYAQKVWAAISWDCSRVNQFNEIILRLPKLNSGYMWSVSRETGKYAGIKVEWKSVYAGPGGQDIVFESLDFQKVGLYIDLVNVNKGLVVDSETYIYTAGAGIEYLPREKRTVGAIDENGNITALYDIWGRPKVSEAVYSDTYGPTRYLTFPDVAPSHWAYRSIYELTAHGYIIGYPDGAFRPDGNISRAEFTVMLKNLLDDKSLSYITKDDALKIFGKSFNPDEKITREEVSAVLYSILKTHPNFSKRSGKSISFTDAKLSKFRDGIYFCSTTGIITGYPDNTFKPKGFITRAEIAALLSKILNRI